jgi:hypothetical protein
MPPLPKVECGRSDDADACPDRLAAAMPVLRRLHDHYRDFRARQQRPRTATLKLRGQDRNAMTPNRAPAKRNCFEETASSIPRVPSLAAFGRRPQSTAPLAEGRHPQPFTGIVIRSLRSNDYFAGFSGRLWQRAGSGGYDAWIGFSNG